MESVDGNIDRLMRNKLIAVIQENAVRIGKINIRYTKLNKKNSLERWNAYFDSYDKLIRNLPRDLIRIEKEVRIKFSEPLSEEREKKLRLFFNNEVDLLFKKLKDACQEPYELHGAQAQLNEKLDALSEKFRKGVDTHLLQCDQSLKDNLKVSKKYSLHDLCENFHIKESFLHELNFLDPLQKIMQIRDNSESDPKVLHAFEKIVSVVQEIVKIFDEDLKFVSDTVQTRKMRKLQVAKETLLFREIILNTELLFSQVSLPEGQRNDEVIEKLWNRIEDLFGEGRKDWAPAQERLRSVLSVAN